MVLKIYIARKKHVVISFVVSVVFLCIGISIYLLCRIMPPMLIKICNIFNIIDYVNYLRVYTVGQITNQFILYSLPDLMWSCASLAFLYGLTIGLQTIHRIIWALPLVVASIGTEVAQGLKLIPGTFDWMDISCYIISFVVYYLKIHYYDKIQFS